MIVEVLDEEVDSIVVEEEATKLDEELSDDKEKGTDDAEDADVVVDVKGSLAGVETRETPAVVENEKTEDVVEVSVGFSLNGTRRSIGVGCVFRLSKSRLRPRRYPRSSLYPSFRFRATTVSRGVLRSSK